MGEEVKSQAKPHVLVLPFPIQGHINPLLQFSKRLISKNVAVTLLTTSSTHTTILRRASSSLSGRASLPLAFVPLDDGFEEGAPTGATAEYLAMFKNKVSLSLSDLISSMDPKPAAVVYDSCLPWALDVARRFGVAGASFFTQSSVVNALYHHFIEGRFREFQDEVVLPAMPVLKGGDLPVFLYDRSICPPLHDLICSQFCNVDEAQFFLVNSFEELEVEILEWMENVWPVKNIGPTVPSMYLDKRLGDEKDYGLSLFNPKVDECLTWLDTKPPDSVVYVSFGSLAVLKDDQMNELASGLKQTGHFFLWVVRETESSKLSSSYLEEISEKGLIVTWSPQLQVLAHKSVGCFVTHCGWNSTLEALSLGVPMVGMPQYSDQPTNAKFIEDVWKVGVRAKADKEGFVTKDEVVRCVGELMEGEKSRDVRRNAEKWRESAKEAVSEGGSSDRNIDEFVAKLWQMK
ncbi:PREDICTED: UDP-glycosyltransferase 74D1 [Tarenaya hassleriana]|uniref:UDP-glycosyltransferase 74D1 n=1 Tax=Tarenaya hassleriana TaxID=28532 RepID=UPI00053C22AD|nr:PREDICTED: UDP-glycosyltransferase 74D1 [Tarenaya hassleriana]XP_010542773.1 PREDICTED: UDP-glycosyltransferase 74D1 [Tarenaya hassleriana]